MNLRGLQLVDTVLQTLERLLDPDGRLTVQEHQGWFVEVAYPLVDSRDGHILGVATAMAMAGLTGRMDMCIAGLFGAGKSRAAAVMLVGMLIACPKAKVLVVCKENAAARSFLQLVESLKPPEGIRSAVGRLVSDEEYSGGIFGALSEARCSSVRKEQTNVREASIDCYRRSSCE